MCEGRQGGGSSCASVVAADGGLCGCCAQTAEADGIVINPTSTKELEDLTRSVRMGSESGTSMADRHPSSFNDGSFGYDDLPFLCLLQRRHLFGVDSKPGAGSAATSAEGEAGA